MGRDRIEAGKAVTLAPHGAAAPHAPHMSNAGHASRARHRRAVLVALLADLAIMVLKFIAAHMSGSSAMFAEGMHSMVDSLTEVVLLYGFLAAARPSTSQFQVGFGRENFFWSFIAALVVLAAGAGVTLIDGVSQMLHPLHQGHTQLNYAVLALSAVIELISSAYILRDLVGLERQGGLSQFIRTTRDTVSLTIMFNSLAGLLGLGLAACGVFFSTALNLPLLDGAASVAIAVILAASAVTIAVKSRTLLIGVPASPATRHHIAALTRTHPEVDTINGSITVYLGPNDLLVALSVTFCEQLHARAIEQAVARIETHLRAEIPDVAFVFIKPQSQEDFARLQKARGW